MKNTTDRVSRTPQTVFRQCHTCLTLEDLQLSGQIFDPVLSALVDHLLLIESELTAVRRLVEESIP